SAWHPPPSRIAASSAHASLPVKGSRGLSGTDPCDSPGRVATGRIATAPETCGSGGATSPRTAHARESEERGAEQCERVRRRLGRLLTAVRKRDGVPGDDLHVGAVAAENTSHD